ncbi:MAG: outer membrane lipoprotein-sorting protein, partial [Bacteroidetes bacterium]
MKKTILIIATFFAIQAATAQTAEEIIANYFENTGGIDNWKALKGIRMKATVNQGGMDIPITMIQMTDGRRYMKLELQGKELAQGVFDGEVAWSHNFMTMKPEKSDNEATENMKRESSDFPDPFLRMDENGYEAELLGKETVEGAECFKIKLTKKPKLVDGVDVDNVSFYFFDTENFVPIMVESEIKTGQMKGKIGVTTFSDYQEVDGLYFAFSMGQGIKDMG